MDYGVQLVLLVIFGFVGFVMGKIVGINPYRIFSDLVAVIFVIALISFVLPVITNPDIAPTNLENMIKFFVRYLPIIIIGDAAGTILSMITGER